MNHYFITGTDTDCGKTYVTVRLVKHFLHAAAIKPIASGCIGQQLVSHDAQLLQAVSNLSLEQINPWCFKLPASPHIAAHREGVCLSALEIAEYCLNLQLEGIDTLFIEGAGGLMVPLNDKETWVDLLRITKIPVILVVGMKLGCINHALLTAEVLHAHEIHCMGWIANCIDPNMHALTENIDTLTQKLHVPLLAHVPFGEHLIQVNSWSN